MENILVNGVEYTPIKKTSPRKTRVCFELTMPNAASWNGKWSGEKDGHFIFKEYTPAYFEKNKDKIIGSWYYRWSDGWCACVTSTIIDGSESRKRKKANRGFCGYNWMVDSVLLVGEILKPEELKAELEERKTVTSNG